MSVMLFGKEELILAGLGSYLSRLDESKGEPLSSRMRAALKATVDDLMIVHASNIRAFQTRYEGRYSNEIEHYTHDDLERGIVLAMMRGDKAGPYLMGGGAAYNCDEDPQYEHGGTIDKACDRIDAGCDYWKATAGGAHAD